MSSPRDAAPVVVVLTGHPRADSYTMAIVAEAVESARTAGARVHVHDVYGDGFDPVLREEESRVSGPESVRPGDADVVVGRYRRELGEADALVVVHPTWWGKPPAAVAGWLDRVLVPGVAYRLAAPGDRPETLLRVRRLLVVNTTETPPAREADDLADPLGDMWGRCVAAYLGREGRPPSVERRVLAEVTAAGQEQRLAWMREVGVLVASAVHAIGGVDDPPP